MQPGIQDSGGRAVCVAWHARADGLPQGLAAALSRAGCATQDVDNEFEAVAHVCRVSGGGQSTVLLLVEPASLRGATGIPGVLGVLERAVPGMALWVYEGDSTPQIRAVAPEEREAWRANPQDRLVAFAVPPLPQPPAGVAAGVQQDAASSRTIRMPGPMGPVEPHAPDRPSDGGSSSPRLRLAGDAAEPAAIPTEPSRREVKPTRQSDNGLRAVNLGEEAPPVPSANLLTDEELAMLLAIEPEKRHK